MAVPAAAAPKTAAAGSLAALALEGLVELGEELVGVDRPEALAGGGPGIDERAELGGILEQVVEAVEGRCHVGVPAGEAVPVGALALDGDAGAGEVRDRERLVAAGLPGIEREVEGGELEAAGIELEAEEVVAQDGGRGLGRGEALLLLAHLAGACRRRR